MNKLYLTLLAALFLIGPLDAATLAINGRPKSVIIVDPSATAVEFYAARQLAENLRQITGAVFEIRTNTTAPRQSILVGQGKAALKYFPNVPYDKLGDEEWVIQTKGNRLLLSGGRPRGALYAVSRFLQDRCGVRWWTPWASRVPPQASLRIADLNIRGRPAFEYREPFWFTAFDADWCWKNLCNGNSSNLKPGQGGCVKYNGGFVHTSYPLVPPDKYFGAHPEWYSLIGGKRVSAGAQLCTSNPKLREFLLDQVREELRARPDARIVSVSQNDCFGPCECDNCKAIDDAEGSHAGSMIALVNYIAGKIAPEFPDAAIDTLAYQYTRKPPRRLRPLPNVIVRLCSIECNFREPLDDPSNAAFADDIRNWSKLTGRLYVWDYVTDFWHYMLPHPNWFVLGPNLRFFQTNHVRGVFEEGAYQSYDSEMEEMRAWVLAQLLRDPQQDDRALIREFLDGYYGAAGKSIWRYLELMENASKGFALYCGSSPDVPFLNFKTLRAAEQLWQQAEQAVAGDEDSLERVRLGHLAVRYAWLTRWDGLRKECAGGGGSWPLDDSKKKVAEEWRSVAHGIPGKPWTKVTAINEAGVTADQFIDSVEK